MDVGINQTGKNDKSSQIYRIFGETNILVQGKKLVDKACLLRYLEHSWLADELGTFGIKVTIQQDVSRLRELHPSGS